MSDKHLTDTEWQQSIVKEVKLDTKPLDYDPKGLADFLDDQVTAGWALIREEAEEALAKNPNDEDAQCQMLAYNNWKRQQELPPERRNGLVISANKPRDRVGTFKRATDGNFYISIAKQKVGDVVRVRQSSGRTQMMRLTGQVASNLYRGIGV